VVVMARMMGEPIPCGPFLSTKPPWMCQPPYSWLSKYQALK
jgi:hypothetical protein